MGRMIKSKREFICSECKNTTMVWSGFCSKCKKPGTIQEHLLAPPKPIPLQTLEQKRIQRRAKNSERNIARKMLSVDGPDPKYENITSSTGRVGHITGMRIDAISRSYVTENKNRKLPSWLIIAWTLLQQRGISFNKNILLHIDPPNMPREYPIEGRKEKSETMSVITSSRHEELIKNERIMAELLTGLDDRDPTVLRYWELKEKFK